MPVKLYTGLPGAGKTLGLVAEMIELERKEPGRPVFVYGINGLNEGIAQQLTEEEVREWDKLPPGSIICIDECQELMPTERGNTPDWIRKISKVRHHGIDFVLTTQHPSLMSAYVRRLVDKHVHLVRKFGSGVCDRYTWGRCMDDPEKRHAQKAAISAIWTHPREVFGKYKSSELHTIKRKLPAKVYIFAALVVVCVGAVAAVPVLVKRAQDHNVAMLGGVAVEKAEQGGRVSSGPKLSPSDEIRITDYPKWMKPRVAGIPWSAPMFDGLQVRAQPRLYCIAADNGKCACRTEQGTVYHVDLLQCRQVAANGLYNPFVDPVQDRESGEARQVSPAGPVIPAEIPATGIAGPRTARATAAPYVSPEYGEWNADPFGSKSGS